MTNVIIGAIKWKLMFTLIGAFLTASCSSFQLSSQQNPPQIYVEVTGSGKDRETALNEAFREAIRQASGVLISSKLQLTDNKMTKDEVSEISAGFVSAYDIKKTYKNEGETFVEIGALVSSSKLLGEFYFEKSENGKVAGDQHYAQVSTYLRSKEQGDRFLEHLASSYPSQALSITLGIASSSVTENRELWFVVPYRVSWSRGYLDAFKETVEYIAQRSCNTGTDKDPRRCDYSVAVFNGDPDTTSGKGYLLADNAQVKILLNRFSDEIGFLLVIEDSAGHELGRFCQRTRVLNQFLKNDENLLSLSNTNIEGRMFVQIASPQVLNRIASVKVKALRSC